MPEARGEDQEGLLAMMESGMAAWEEAANEAMAEDGGKRDVDSLFGGDDDDKDSLFGDSFDPLFQEEDEPCEPANTNESNLLMAVEKGQLANHEADAESSDSESEEEEEKEETAPSPPPPPSEDLESEESEEE